MARSKLDLESVFSDGYKRYERLEIELDPRRSDYAEELSPFFVHRFTYIFDDYFDVSDLNVLVKAPKAAFSRHYAHRVRRGKRTVQKPKVSRINMRVVFVEDGTRKTASGWYAISRVLSFDAAFEQAAKKAKFLLEKTNQSRDIQAVDGIEFVFEPPDNYVPEGFQKVRRQTTNALHRNRSGRKAKKSEARGSKNRSRNNEAIRHQKRSPPATGGVVRMRRKKGGGR